MKLDNMLLEKPFDDKYRFIYVAINKELMWFRIVDRKRYSIIIESANHHNVTDLDIIKIRL